MRLRNLMSGRIGSSLGLAIDVIHICSTCSLVQEVVVRAMVDAMTSPSRIRNERDTMQLPLWAGDISVFRPELCSWVGANESEVHFNFGKVEVCGDKAQACAKCRCLKGCAPSWKCVAKKGDDSNECQWFTSGNHNDIKAPVPQISGAQLGNS